MKEVLLVSAATIRATTNIHDNVSDKYLLPAIREAQEIHLRGYLGYVLLEKLKSLVESGDIERQPKYKELLEWCRYFLTYSAIVELLMKVGYKVANMGVVRTSDENVENISSSEMVLVKSEYQSKADYYAKQLQKYLCDQYSQFPELSEEKYNQLRANLRSAATSGLWLGGVIGKNRAV